jgi:hypothetical protein
MQKLKMLPHELKAAFFGQLITVHRSSVCKHRMCEVVIRHFGSPGSLVPLKGRCEILDVTYQESNILELAKPQSAAFFGSHQWNNAIGICELALGSAWCARHSRPKIRIPIERQKHTENEILMLAASKAFAT